MAWNVPLAWNVDNTNPLLDLAAKTTVQVTLGSDPTKVFLSVDFPVPAVTPVNQVIPMTGTIAVGDGTPVPVGPMAVHFRNVSAAGSTSEDASVALDVQEPQPSTPQITLMPVTQNQPPSGGPPK